MEFLINNNSNNKRLNMLAKVIYIPVIYIGPQSHVPEVNESAKRLINDLDITDGDKLAFSISDVH